MSFDLSLIQQFIQNLDVQSASAIASLSAFFFDISTYFADKQARNEQATIDDYLESLRRRDHNELVELIRDNREAFQKLFEGARTEILDAIGSLKENIERLRSELTDLDVDLSKLELSLTGWSANSGIYMHGRQSTRLNASLTIVNRNRTNLTLTGVSGTMLHESNEVGVRNSEGRQLIHGNGASESVKLTTAGPCNWAQEDPITVNELQLTFDQVSSPICFKYEGSVFRPTANA